MVAEAWVTMMHISPRLQNICNDETDINTKGKVIVVTKRQDKVESSKATNVRNEIYISTPQS